MSRFGRLTADAVTVPDRMSEAARLQRDQLWLIGVVLATVSYQAALCFLNTYGLSASRTLLGLSEGIILAACMPIIFRRIQPGVLLLATSAGAIFCFLALVSGQLNIKTIRDLAIPLCYFWLGCNLGRPEFADKALRWAVALVLVMGLFELLALDTYTNLFNIYSYYVNTGNLDPTNSYASGSKLQLNGTRPEGIGRTLLPQIFGSHRVSSVFLEPVSLGNFATLCAAWGLSKERSDLKSMLFFLLTAIAMIVISDSRFALTSVGLMIVMRLVLTGKAYYLPVFAPFAAVVMLLALGGDTYRLMEDSFSGRLALSGSALYEFGLDTLFATTVPDAYADMGYAHLISAFGLPLTLVLWASIWLLPMPDAVGERFRSFAAIYITLILCVSGFSLYALKTSGVLWLLMGSCLKNPAPLPVRLSLPPRLFLPAQLKAASPPAPGVDYVR